MNILLTGVNSFIGRNLGSWFHQQGHTVTGTVRREKHESFRPAWLKKSLILDLSEPEDIDGSFFEDIQIVIHLAHDFRPGTAEVNIGATKILAERAFEAGAGKQIYFSSYSARPDSVSEYGFVKHSLERYFLENGHIIVRPGLVIGNGGMFKRLYDAVKKFPVIPLIDGGKGEAPIVSMRQLCEVVGRLVSSPLSGMEVNIFYPELITMRTLADVMKSVSNSKALFVPVPLGVAILTAGICSLFGIKLPFDAGSAKSFRKNQEKIYESNVADFLDDYDSARDSVKAAFSGARG